MEILVFNSIHKVLSPSSLVKSITSCSFPLWKTYLYLCNFQQHLTTSLVSRKLRKQSELFCIYEWLEAAQKTETANYTTNIHYSQEHSCTAKLTWMRGGENYVLPCSWFLWHMKVRYQAFSTTAAFQSPAITFPEILKMALPS